MDQFIVKVIVGVITDPKVQQSIKDILGGLITERILPLLPLIAASTTKAVTEALPNVVTTEIGHVADTVRNDLNKAIPDFDLGIPAIDDLLDFWRPKGNA